MNVSIARVTLTDYAQTHLDHSSVLVRSDLPEMVSSVEVGWYDILLTLCNILAQRFLHYYNDSCVADSYKALYCSRYCSPSLSNTRLDIELLQPFLSVEIPCKFITAKLSIRKPGSSSMLIVKFTWCFHRQKSIICFIAMQSYKELVTAL
jgi:hypothetical protein